MLSRLRPGFLVAAILVCACVSLEDTHIPKGGIIGGQRTLVTVFAGPGPVFSQEDNKAETAAKLTPGLAYIVQSAQDERDVAASKDLLQYLPVWDPTGEFYKALHKELPNAGHPGRLLCAQEAGVAADDLKGLDKANDILDWRLHYYLPNPDHPVPRNYSTFLQLDDALVFEVNMVYGVAMDDQQNAAPQLSAMTKLYRAGTMHLLWKHENTVDAKAAQKLLYEYKRNGQALIDEWRKLLPTLAKSIVTDYRKELTDAGLYRPSGFSTTTSSGTASASSLPSGWSVPVPSSTTAVVPASDAALPSGWIMPSQPPAPEPLPAQK